MSKVGRFQLVDQLFRAVVRLPEHERGPYLDEHCAQDAALKVEVLALLREDQIGGALDQPALGSEIDLRNLSNRAASAPPAPLPERIGGYRIVSVIGQGGMGIVYEAEQDEPRRRVALKVIRNGMVTRHLLQRFRHEAHVLGQLTHPGIAQIYEAGTADSGEGGQPYFAMELIKGEPLLEHVDRQGLGTRQRLELAARVCDAVHHAHLRGVIHRDLKPANILVDNAGQPKILDFGVARATNSDTQTVTMQTDIGELVGTVAYMSPEQAAGDPQHIDARSDVHALGVIIFELLTGRLPYEVRDKMIHEAVRVIREDDPRRLSSLSKVFRGDVETIVERAIEKDPQRRYQSAAELAADIRRYLDDQPIVARPASALYQLRKFTRRNRKLVIGVSAGVIIAFAAMAAATVISLRQSHLATQAKRLADARSVVAERQAYRATIAAAAASLAQDDPLSAHRFLDAAPESLRNWEWRHLQAQLDTSTLFLPHDQAAFIEFLVGDDPNRVTTIDADGRIVAWNVGTGQSTPIAQLDTRHIFLCVGSPAAGRLTILDSDLGSKSRRLLSVDASNGKIVAQTAVEVVHAMAVTSDGRWVAAHDWAHVYLWRVEGNEGPVEVHNSRLHGPIAITDTGRTVVVDGDTVRVFNAAGDGHVSPGGVRQATVSLAATSDGSRIIAGDVFGTVYVFEAADAPKSIHRIKAHAGYAQRLCFLADGARFASGGGPGDSTIRIWNTDTGEPQSVLLGCVNGVIRLAASPDNRSVIAIDRQGDLRIWNLDDRHATTVLRGHELYVYDAIFSPDNARLYTASWDRTIRVWNAHTGECLNVFKGETRYITALALSPNGRLIASGNHQGYWSETQVRLWDAESGVMLGELAGPRGQVTAVAFSADGTKLAACAVLSGVHAWDIQSLESPVEIPAVRNPRREPWQVAWSPDDKALATCYADCDVIVADAATGKELLKWKAHERTTNFLDYSPDGSMIVTVSGDGLVKLWNASTAQLIHTLEGHRDIGWCAGFSPDGSRLATGSTDNTIRIWDVESGQHLLELRGHDDYVHSVQFSPDGAMLASTSGDGTVRIWNTRPLHERSRARATGAAD